MIVVDNLTKRYGAKTAVDGLTLIRGEEEIVLAVDEDARNPRQIRQGSHMAVRLTVEDVDPTGAGVRDVDAPTGTCTVVDVRMIEPRTIARRDRDEALLGQCHLHAPFACVRVGFACSGAQRSVAES